ncbi:hypothetical protein K503DRAFT_782257 [Rhizopogon vinicolor AM-OR11-026]|uniref:Uncharacterized protein n=1 Tax=Rhizopogon vinicolor AM-OR11-026 TaxID=1314800 RepID=A0A1B7N356_9AGAM|nr:hypothetical protein K503DRAFT_782257 [Rhizopogon vinicolor AM-OR11-026]
MNYPEPYIHRLPVELLQKIFLLVVNDVYCPRIFLYGKTTISANFTSPPLVFTLVCCRWRAVAHTTPGIWSRIQVAFSGRPEPLKPFLPSLLESWLGRSAQPLTLRIVFEECYNPPYSRRQLLESSEADSQLFKILLSESRRWETVAIASPIQYWSHDFDTPKLTALGCSLRDLSRFNAPDLHYLCTRVSRSAVTEFKPTPSCKNVRHLRLRDADSAYALRETLVIFPHLETIVVDAIETHFREEQKPITNSCLESMTLPLEVGRKFRLQRYLDGVHLPKLKELIIVGGMNKEETAYVNSLVECYLEKCRR